MKRNVKVFIAQHLRASMITFVLFLAVPGVVILVARAFGNNLGGLTFSPLLVVLWMWFGVCLCSALLVVSLFWQALRRWIPFSWWVPLALTFPLFFTIGSVAAALNAPDAFATLAAVPAVTFPCFLVYWLFLWRPPEDSKRETTNQQKEDITTTN